MTDLKLGKIAFGPSTVKKDVEQKVQKLLARKHAAERKEIEQEVREECAVLVEAAGCLCVALYRASQVSSRFGCTAFWDSTNRLIEHDRRCPEALATVIRAKGGVHG